MKKVLFLIPSLGGGGAEKVLTTLVNRLCEYNYDITIIVIFGNGIYEKQIDKRVHVKQIFSSRSNSGKMWKYIHIFRNKMLCLISGKRLYKWFVRGQYDYEIAYLEGLSTKIISGSDTDSRKIAWVHVDPEVFGYSKTFYRCEKDEVSAYRIFDDVFCVSEAVRNSFENKYGIKAKVILNMIDRDDIIKRSYETIIDDVNEKCLHLVSVGRMSRQKGFERLLKALKKLKELNYKFDIQILGIGELWADLKNLSIQYGLEDHIIWRGFQVNPYPYMRSADAFICSSLTEGYCTAVVESIILSVPVITTDCAGMREIFGGYQCGRIVDNSEEGIYCGIKEILDNPESLTYMREEARRRSQNFDTKSKVDEFIAEALK